MDLMTKAENSTIQVRIHLLSELNFDNSVLDH